MAGSGGAVAGGLCCVAVVIVGGIVGSMVKTLPAGQIALEMNWWTQTLMDEPVTDPGIHFLTPGNHFLYFPDTYQIMYFANFNDWTPENGEIHRPPIRSRTRDGLEIQAEVSYQWKLQPENLHALYSQLGSANDLLYGEETEVASGSRRWRFEPGIGHLFVRLARGSLTEVCSRFTANQFFAERSKVEMQLLDALSATFNNPMAGLAVAIKGLQLRSVHLPKQFEQAISDTQQMEQEIQVAEAERQTQEIAQETEMLKAQQKVMEDLQGAEGRAQQLLTENEAVITQYVNSQERQADAYAEISSALGEGGKNYAALFELMKQRMLKDHKKEKMMLALQ